MVSGFRSGLPNIPKFPGQEKFKGEIMHAEGFTDVPTYDDIGEEYVNPLEVQNTGK